MSVNHDSDNMGLSKFATSTQDTVIRQRVHKIFSNLYPNVLNSLSPTLWSRDFKIENYYFKGAPAK